MSRTATTIQYSPTGVYDDCAIDYLREACGLLLPWMTAPRPVDETMRESVLRLYQFPVPPMTGGKLITPTGVYQYPEDPDLHPFVRVYDGLSGDLGFIYPYGMVSFYEKEPSTLEIVTTIYRMD